MGCACMATLNVARLLCPGVPPGTQQELTAGRGKVGSVGLAEEPLVTIGRTSWDSLFVLMVILNAVFLPAKRHSLLTVIHVLRIETVNVAQSGFICIPSWWPSVDW